LKQRRNHNHRLGTMPSVGRYGPCV